jgi:hypothetical protein
MATSTVCGSAENDSMGLDIRSAIELGEPHWHPEQAVALMQHGGFDLVVAALRSLPSINGGYVEVSDAYLARPARDVLREYLAETGREIENWDHFRQPRPHRLRGAVMAKRPKHISDH